MIAGMRIAALTLALLVAGCVSTRRTAPVPGVPAFDPIAFFDGPTQGTGILRIAFHHAEHTLVEGIGHAGGADAIVLDQTVRRGDRTPTHRQWRLTRIAPGRYTGTLSDAVGPVTGDVRGDRLHLAFRTKGGLGAQQWLVLQPGGHEARNVLILRKHGMPVARLDETIVRQ